MADSIKITHAALDDSGGADFGIPLQGWEEWVFELPKVPFTPEYVRQRKQLLRWLEMVGAVQITTR